jgi:hypothetical protein
LHQACRRRAAGQGPAAVLIAENIDILRIFYISPGKYGVPREKTL